MFSKKPLELTNEALIELCMLGEKEGLRNKDWEGDQNVRWYLPSQMLVFEGQVQFDGSHFIASGWPLALHSTACEISCYGLHMALTSHNSL